MIHNIQIVIYLAIWMLVPEYYTGKRMEDDRGWYIPHSFNWLCFRIYWYKYMLEKE